MEKIRIDYLNNHIDYKVCQHEDMYHFNSDTCLLGEFININKSEKVLDVGTNNGALLIYIIKKGGIATGIEINDKALEVCQMTLDLNSLKATLINQDFKTYKSEEKYDVIVTNPPYFNTTSDAKKSVNEHIKIARHEQMLTLKDLCKGIKDNLKESGRLYMVHRPNRLNEISNELNKNGLYIDYYQQVFDKNTNKNRSVLICASYTKKEGKRIEDLYI